MYIFLVSDMLDSREVLECPVSAKKDSIMNYNRNRDVICSPRSLDISNVNAIY